MAKSASPRIPLELQKIFLASNAGEVVNEPPKGLGFRVFRRAFRLASINGRKLGKALGRSGSQHSVTNSTEKSNSAIETSCLDGFETPQLLLEALLSERGYSTAKYNTAATSFRFTPTPYELASFHAYTLKIVEEEKSDAPLRDVLEAGISPNACNRDCELLLHKACRLGKHQHVRAFLEFGVDLRVCSVFGRTALHDTCYSPRPSFQTFALLVEKDPSLLFMKDCRGLCPLEYIRKDHYVFWLEYLESNVEKFWPRLCDEQPKMSSRRLGEPFTRTLAKPSNALPPELAHMIASGRMTAKEVLLLVDDTDCSAAPAVNDNTACSEQPTDDSSDASESSENNDDEEYDDDKDCDDGRDGDDDESSICSDDDALLSELGGLLGSYRW